MRSQTVFVIIMITLLLLITVACGNTKKETPSGEAILDLFKEEQPSTEKQIASLSAVPRALASQEAHESVPSPNIQVTATVSELVIEPEPTPLSVQEEQATLESPTENNTQTTSTTQPLSQPLTQATVSAPEQASKADFVLALTRVEQKNENKIITISLIPTALVARIEFDLGLNNYTYDSIDAETVARTANKEVISTVTSLQTIHVTIQGTNELTMDEGDLATVYFTGNGSRYLTLSNIQGSDPAGKALVGKG